MTIADRGSAIQVRPSQQVNISAEFDALIADRAIEAVFQPIVALHDGSTVGYEALARAPTGSAFHQAAVLFRYAARAGRVAELDWICRAAACRGALAAGLPWQMPLFINVEPSTVGQQPFPDLVDAVIAALERLQIVVEMTERSLSRDPAHLLAAVERVRHLGLRVALDDVGADPASLAMMPLVSADVIKLDRRVVQNPDTPAIIAIVNAVRSETERTGAIVLAEGIETPQHLAAAASMGATLGQGWLFGRPGPLPHHLIPSEVVLPQIAARFLPRDAVTARTAAIHARPEP